MEAMLGISLYSYLSQTSKNAVFLIIAYVFSSTKLENNRVEQILPGSGGVGVAQTMYTHVSKCKNDKINKNKIKRLLIFIGSSCILVLYQRCL
jgi:hypothetical protein